MHVKQRIVKGGYRMDNKNVTKFSKVEEKLKAAGFGKVSPTELEVVEVQINPDSLLNSYTKHFVDVVYTNNEKRATRLNFNEDDCKRYFLDLLYIRVTLANKSKNWRRSEYTGLKMPIYIETLTSAVGVVTLQDLGIKLIPVMEDRDIDMKWLDEFSSQLEGYTSGVALVDTLYNKPEGDASVMSLALIDGMVKGITEDTHPIAILVSATLGASIDESLEDTFLYRYSYDFKSSLLSAMERYGADLCR